MCKLFGWQGFCKDVSNVVVGGYIGNQEMAMVNVFANGMEFNINVFSLVVECRIFCQDVGTIIIGKDWGWMDRCELNTAEESTKPNCLFRALIYSAPIVD